MDTTVKDSKRNLMWCDIFGYDYCGWNKQTKRKRKAEYAKERGLQVKDVNLLTKYAEDYFPDYPEEVELDCCKTACPPDPVKKPKRPKEDFFDDVFDRCRKTYKKENAMNSAASMSINAPAPLTEANVDLNKRDYLSQRLQSLYYEKDQALEEKFGLVDQPAPKTPKEVVERVKAGLFIFTSTEKSDSEEAWEFSNPWRGLRWRDPSVKEDRVGYRAARETLMTEKAKIYDGIMIKDPLEALAELQAWEAA